MARRFWTAGAAAAASLLLVVAVMHFDEAAHEEIVKQSVDTKAKGMSKQEIWAMLRQPEEPETAWEDMPDPVPTDAVDMPPLPDGATMPGTLMETTSTTAQGMPPVPDSAAVPAMPPAATSAGVTLIQETHVEEIKTPAMKTRQRRKLILPNEMQVLIVSDPDLPESAAGLANKDGSWQNPDDALGLAHFNEHMVFMGTKKHPKASSFDNFLTANGAQSSNAATGSAVTQYAFSVAHNAFPEALDRFADMFTEPLMNNAGLKKEINAVNQEYEMHKDDDGWRQLFVEKATANPKHPYSRFSIGTLHSLGKVDHKKIKSFFEKYYSSNLMSAMIYTVLPLDEAQELVIKHLGQVPNRHLKETHVDMPVMDPALKKTAVWQKSITTQYGINLKWELPEGLSQKVQANAETCPDRLVSHVINYQGENGLFDHLRKKGLIHSISSGQSDKGFDMSGFAIDVSLTPKGFENWKSVVEEVFAAIAKLKQTGVPKHIFDTIQTNDLIGWQWQWRTSDVFNAAMDGASALAHTRDFASYPYVDNILQKYDGAKVKELLEVLKPEDVHIYAMSPDFPKGLDDIKTDTEPHYHTEWKVQHLPEDTIKAWSEVEPSQFLEIPAANPYLPKKLAVTKDIDPNPPVYPAIPSPDVLLDTEHEKVHIWQDKMFGDPYVTGELAMKTDKGILEKEGVDVLMQMSLMLECVNHAITPKMQPFDEAGLSWSLGGGTGTNIVMSFSGTNTEPEHYTAVLKQLSGYVKDVAAGSLGDLVDEPTFQMLKTSVVHSLENSLKGSPSGLAFSKLRHVMNNIAYPVPDQIAATKRTTFEQVKAVAPKLFKKAFYTGFFTGQVKPEEVKAAWKNVMDTLPATGALAKDDWMHTKMRQLPQKPQFLHTQGTSRGNAAVLVVDAGGLDCQQREALSMLYQAVPNRFYNDLRSKQQTGYLVQTSTEVMVSHHNIVNFIVQSSQYKPGDLLHRYQKFIAEMMTDLASDKSETLPKEKFDMIKKAKLSKYDTPNQNIGTMGSTMQTLLENYSGDWTTLEKKKKITEDMQYEAVLAVAKAVFSNENKRQLAIAYTTKGDELDKLPQEFIQFDAKEGEFIGKPKFSCPVDLTPAMPVAPADQTTAASADSA